MKRRANPTAAQNVPNNSPYNHQVVEESQDAAKAEKQLAEKLKGEEKEIKEEEAKNSAEEKAAERKVTIEGSKVTVEKNTSTEPTTDKEK